MYKTILVKEAIVDGDRLLEALETRGFPVVAAFWYHLPDLVRWRLFIVSPLVHDKGPRAAYEIIQQTLAGMQPHSISPGDITVLSPQEDAFQRLRAEMEWGGLWTTSRSRNDVVFEDAYVYRL